MASCGWNQAGRWRDKHRGGWVYGLLTNSSCIIEPPKVAICPKVVIHRIWVPQILIFFIHSPEVFLMITVIIFVTFQYNSWLPESFICKIHVSRCIGVLSDLLMFLSIHQLLPLCMSFWSALVWCYNLHVTKKWITCGQYRWQIILFRRVAIICKQMLLHTFYNTVQIHCILVLFAGRHIFQFAQFYYGFLAV